MIGRTLGHYRIVDRLGSGGMGVVWLAEDLKLRRRVALKMLREEAARSADKAVRFDREAKAIAALSHPNIVTIHAFEEIDGVRFLAMEYLEGQTLAELIPAGGFPLPELLRLAAPVADALAAAHARGVTHRDLKPSNIFVTTEGRVKVLDFGLAKLQGGEVTQIYGREHEPTLTHEGTVVGTLHYMSPEQLQMKHIDHRSDVYALGVVLYEMATGDLPFRGESAAQVISSVLRDRPRRLDDLDSRIPPEIADLVASCLEKNADRRLASAAEARDRLNDIARDLETGALSLASSRLRRLVGGPNRTRVRALAAGIAALAVAVVTIPWAIREIRESRSGGGAGAGDVAEVGIPSIAVLPFANYSGDPDYFVDGMTDGVIGALGRLGGVRVISRQSAMHYKNSTKKLPEIAEELGVDLLIEGSVARDGETIRLQARLVRPDPERQIWAESYDRPMSRVMALHESVALEVLRAAGAESRGSSAAGDRVATHVEPAVYEAYLQGRYFSDRFDEASLKNAEERFRHALALNPTFAPALHGLAQTIYYRSLSEEEPHDLRESANNILNRALTLDPGLASAYALRAEMLFDQFDWEGADEALARAIQLDPNAADAYQKLWMLRACQRRLDEALEAITAARKLDPLSARISANLGLQLVLMERPHEATQFLDSALSLDPSYGLAHVYLYLAYDELEKDPERGDELAHYIEFAGFTERSSELQIRLKAEGFESARRWIASELARDPESTKPWRLTVVAGLLAQAGETEEALRLLEAGRSRRAWELAWLAVSPDYKNLREEERFRQLLRSIGLPIPTPSNARNQTFR